MNYIICFVSYKVIQLILRHQTNGKQNIELPTSQKTMLQLERLSPYKDCFNFLIQKVWSLNSMNTCSHHIKTPRGIHRSWVKFSILGMPILLFLMCNLLTFMTCTRSNFYWKYHKWHATSCAAPMLTPTSQVHQIVTKEIQYIILQKCNPHRDFDRDAII